MAVARLATHAAARALFARGNESPNAEKDNRNDEACAPGKSGNVVNPSGEKLLLFRV